ncbi:MAG: universal stress protein [Flavobacteriaceae bacterium]|nr:universal stress protein [Flavobacteriaceae bacterium]
MNRILLPTDFSENSKNAIIYALEFFRGQSCHFVILNVQKPSEFVLDDFYTAPATATLHETILTDNKKALETLLKELKEPYLSENYSFKAVTEFDSLTHAISQMIDTENLDLVIMGSNGATGASEIVFGSNTLKVIRQVDCPVLIIPEGYRYQKLDTLLFSVHNQEIDIQKMGLLKNIIKLKKPKVRLLNIEDAGKSKERPYDSSQLDHFFEQKIHEYHTLEGVPLAIGIDAFVQLHSVQLHALFMERESFLKRFLIGSANSEINYKSRVPLLVLRHIN